MGLQPPWRVTKAQEKPTAHSYIYNGWPESSFTVENKTFAYMCLQKVLEMMT